MELVSRLFCFSISEPRETNLSSNQNICSRQEPSDILEELCHHFSLAEIQSAMRNVKEEPLVVGGDSLGIVYKGYLNKSGTPVTIKLFRKGSLSGLSESQLKNEVVLLCQLHHPNLMPLIGFCIERDHELILIHEYMSNGSLHDQLHNSNNHKVDPLPWKRRLQICIGVARGLHYLHTGAKYSIIHHYINTYNILLDKNWNPKVSGLFLSKRGPVDVSRSYLRVRNEFGTLGYIDPEYMTSGMLTEKSNVFSFGMVLLEVVTAMQASDLYLERMNKLNYSLESNAKKLVDPFLKSKIAPDSWKTFIGITERCLHKHGTERPNMGEVEVELEHALQLQEESDAKIGCNS